MTITFDSISPNQRVPGSQVEFSSVRALNGLPAAAHKILVVGQRLATGSVPALTPRRIVQPGQAAVFFGQGSIIAGMITALFRANSETEVWAVATADPVGSVARVLTATFTGTAAAAGAVSILLGGRRYLTAVAAGDTAATIAANVAVTINADAARYMTATSSAGDLILTARNKGTIGHDIAFLYSFYEGEYLPSGVGLSNTDTTSGTLTPVLDDVWAAIGDEQYHTIIVGQSDATAMTSADTEMRSRWGPSRQIEGRVYAATYLPYASAITYGAARNGIFTTVIAASSIPTPTFEVAAATAGIAALALHIDPARPLTDLVVPGVIAPSVSARFVRSEREQLLRAGISTLRTLSNGSMAIERLVSTYKLSELNLPDPTWLDITTTATLGYYRSSWRARMAQKFPRAKLTRDTIAAVRAETIALAREWEEAGLMEDVDTFIANLVLERDASNVTQLNVLMTPDTVNGLLQLDGRIEFIL